MGDRSCQKLTGRHAARLVDSFWMPRPLCSTKGTKGKHAHLVIRDRLNIAMVSMCQELLQEPSPDLLIHLVHFIKGPRCKGGSQSVDDRPLHLLALQHVFPRVIETSHGQVHRLLGELPGDFPHGRSFRLEHLVDSHEVILATREP